MSKKFNFEMNINISRWEKTFNELKYFFIINFWFNFSKEKCWNISSNYVKYWQTIPTLEQIKMSNERMRIIETLWMKKKNSMLFWFIGTHNTHNGKIEIHSSQSKKRENTKIHMYICVANESYMQGKCKEDSILFITLIDSFDRIIKYIFLFKLICDDFQWIFVTI